MNKAKNNDCPRCGGKIPNNETPGAYLGALSRWDNKTYVCSSCGQEEALLQFAENMARNGHPDLVVHPTDGAVIWVKSPI